MTAFSIFDALRQTGRTTRMCQEIFDVASVVGPERLVDLVVLTPEHLPTHPIFPPNVRILTICEAMRDIFDVNLTPSESYMASGNILYIDHAVYEKYYSNALKELHRWDQYLRFPLSQD